MTKRIVVIPDIQARPNEDFTFLKHIGQYLVKIKPDTLIQIGDFGDLPSLSTHDKPGSKGMEGLRYKKDLESIHLAMNTLLSPIVTEQKRLIKNKSTPWKLRKILTLGNHEDRITRAIYNDPKLDGLISLDDLKYKEWGWEVYPFLETVEVEGIAFSHYFVSGIMGRPCTTAQALITKHHMSCFAGHQQGRMIAYSKNAVGKEITAIIAGSCYTHKEAYLNPQTNTHWRGLYVLNDVCEGSFDEMPVSLKYLKKRYSKS